MRLSFRTKVLGIVVPALVVLLALAVIVVRRSLNEASGASDDRQSAEVARVAMSLRDELQNESRLALLVLNFADGTGRKEYESQQAVTNAAAADFRTLLDRLGASSRFAAADTDLSHVVDDELPKVRSEVTSGAGDTVLGGVARAYDDTIVDMSTVAVRFVGTANTALLSARSAELIELLGAKDTYSNQLAAPLRRLNGSALNDTDGAVYLESVVEANRSLDRAAAVARPETVAALEAFRSSELAAQVARRGEEYATAGKVNKAPRFSGPEWLALATGAAAGLDQIEDSLFDQYLARAQSIADNDRRNALVLSAFAGLGVLAAVIGALLVGRSLSRRLGRVTAAAHDIATTRLPEVLAALRNPTSEAVAGAVPEIPSQGNDEVGQLADDFNKVLRTAVETSVEHSQRRAATLTNLLVNLGRRNQALIDRQLELVDQLEADQPDQRTLAGLFKLDHMITRQRRNAESLLVLAGSRRSRGWTESIPISDVLQGAISEVAQMDRVSLEIQPGNDLVFGGLHAVDLSHLVAELVENATAYSSPTTRVTVRVQRNASQFRIWIIDSGVGMGDDEVAAANLRVTSPPDIDEITTDQVGFQVVGRLAQRIGAGVRLQNNPAGGVAVSIDLPISLFEVIADDSARRRSAPPATIDDLPAFDDDDTDLAWAELEFDDGPTASSAAPHASLAALEASLPTDFATTFDSELPTSEVPLVSMHDRGEVSRDLPTSEIPAVAGADGVFDDLPDFSSLPPLDMLSATDGSTDGSGDSELPAGLPRRSSPVANTGRDETLPRRGGSVSPGDLPRRERGQAAPERAIRQLLPTVRTPQPPRPGIAAAVIGESANPNPAAPPLQRRNPRPAVEIHQQMPNPAQAAQSGLFRRLPGSSASGQSHDEAALARRQNLSKFTRAVEEVRDGRNDEDGVQQ